MKKITLILLVLCPYFASANFDTLYVPSDAKAKYTVIQNKRVGDLSILQTIRKSSYGTSFSTRLFNCKKATFKYLVDVEGVDNMNIYLAKNNEAMENLNDSNMSDVVKGSIAYYAYKYACK